MLIKLQIQSDHSRRKEPMSNTEIKRYVLAHNDPKQSNDKFHQMLEFPTGFYVKFSDIEPVLKENEELRKKLDKARVALEPFVLGYQRYGNHGHFSHGVYIKAQEALREIE